MTLNHSYSLPKWYFRHVSSFRLNPWMPLCYSEKLRTPALLTSSWHHVLIMVHSKWSFLRTWLRIIPVDLVHVRTMYTGPMTVHFARGDSARSRSKVNGVSLYIAIFKKKKKAGRLVHVVTSIPAGVFKVLLLTMRNRGGEMFYPRLDSNSAWLLVSPVVSCGKVLIGLRMQCNQATKKMSGRLVHVVTSIPACRFGVAVLLLTMRSVQ